MNDLLNDIIALPSFDAECHGCFGDEMVKQRPSTMEDIQRWGEHTGAWIRSEDVILLLKKHNLL